MKALSTFIICLFLSFGNTINAQNPIHLKTINTYLWENFTKAFEHLDYDLFSSLHSENLVRVGGDYKSIRNKTEYINGYKERWKNKDFKQTISFRFIERICDSEKASERGIYKLTRHPETQKEKSFYGKFHVILKKENGVWKILVDYDSSENNTINESAYQNAYEIEDFEKYQK